jgi:hypothetical protein
VEKIGLNQISIKNHSLCLPSGPHHFSAAFMGSVGFGSDFKETLALKKAVNELFERITYKTTTQSTSARSSNGFAAHNSFDVASESAIQEIIERDAVLVTWLIKRAPRWLEISDLIAKIKPQFKDLVFLIESLNMQVHFGVLARTGPFVTIGGYLVDSFTPSRFGLLFSSSCKRTEAEATESVLLEISRGIEMILSRIKLNKPTFNPVRDISEIKNSAMHLEYFLDPTNFEKAAWVFSGSASELELPYYPPQVRKITANYLPSWDFVVAHAADSRYQDLYFGLPSSFDVNMNRIADSTYNETKLNLGIHYLP